MSKKILNVIETAYRATIEEQDDTIVWLSHAMQGQEGNVNVLLCGNAVNYAVKDQDASGLRFGEWRQTQPPKIDKDLQSLAGKGVDVYYIEEDVAERGLERSDLIAGLKPLSQSRMHELFESHDLVFRW